MYYCKKNERRSLINLFKLFDCDNCKYLLEDDVIKIGYHYIKIFYLENKCIFEKDYKYYKDSKRLKLIFKDIIISEIKKERNIFLWLEINDDFSKYFDALEYFLNNGYNIIIII